MLACAFRFFDPLQACPIMRGQAVAHNRERRSRLLSCEFFRCERLLSCCNRPALDLGEEGPFPGTVGSTARSQAPPCFRKLWFATASPETTGRVEKLTVPCWLVRVSERRALC